MAQFTKTLCEEVIRTQGRVKLTDNEKLQMAYIALRELERRVGGVKPAANELPSDIERR
jgi:hypothetical protein